MALHFLGRAGNNAAGIRLGIAHGGHLFRNCSVESSR
jgi:hypothetical protein